MPHPSTLDAARGRLQVRSGRGTNGSVHGGLGSGRGGPGSTQQRPTPVYPGEHPRTAPGATREEEGGGRGRRARLAPAAAAGACPRRGTAPPPHRGPPMPGLPRPGWPCRATTPGACHAAAVGTRDGARPSQERGRGRTGGEAGTRERSVCYESEAGYIFGVE